MEGWSRNEKQLWNQQERENWWLTVVGGRENDPSCFRSDEDRREFDVQKGSLLYTCRQLGQLYQKTNFELFLFPSRKINFRITNTPYTHLYLCILFKYIGKKYLKNNLFFLKKKFYYISISDSTTLRIIYTGNHSEEIIFSINFYLFRDIIILLLFWNCDSIERTKQQTNSQPSIPLEHERWNKKMKLSPKREIPRWRSQSC